MAVAVYLTFVAHALASHPEWRTRLAGGDGSEDEMFVQEVRRSYPFFPAITRSPCAKMAFRILTSASLFIRDKNWSSQW